MKKIIYATTNKGKLASLREACSQYNITVEQPHPNFDIPEPRSSDVQEIARHKVEYAFDRVQDTVVSMDAGFYIDELGGFPRAYVNFALETIDVEGILKLATGTNRACEFRQCLAYLDHTRTEPEYFYGVTRGTLSDAPRGTNTKNAWSRLWTVFIPEGCTQTLAEMSQDEFDAWHKTRRQKDSASWQFAQWYAQH